MNTNFLKLKKVPAVSKQELLIYITGLDANPMVKITTIAGFVYYGLVINAGNTRDSRAMLVLQLVGEKGGATDSLLHIEISNIESIEIAGEQDAMNIFSLGRIASNPQYTVSGKLDVQRRLKAFAETVYADAGVQLGMPEITLPADGLALGRILKLIEIIQQVIIEVLKEEDARSSWQEKYCKIFFLNSGSLEVTGEAPVITIHFPFNDIEAPEISQAALNDKLLAVL